jgi:cell division septation protein DedD
MKPNIRKPRPRPDQGSRSVLNLGRKQFLVWGSITFFAMVWMFVLGILVGRGLSPVRFDVPKLKGDLITLKEKMLPTQDPTSEGEAEVISKDPNLDFYKALADKQKEPSTAVTKRDEPPAAPEIIEAVPSVPPAEPKTAEQTGEEMADVQGEISAPPVPEEPGSYTIQVAAFKRIEKARALIARLRQKGYDAYEVSASLPNRGNYHRVRVGHFADAKEAGLTASKLREERLETIIVRND